MHEWADLHGETNMTMRQFEDEEAREAERIDAALGNCECPDCGTGLATDDTLRCASCGQSWEEYA